MGHRKLIVGIHHQVQLVAPPPELLPEAAVLPLLKACLVAEVGIHITAPLASQRWGKNFLTPSPTLYATDSYGQRKWLRLSTELEPHKELCRWIDGWPSGRLVLQLKAADSVYMMGASGRGRFHKGTIVGEEKRLARIEPFRALRYDPGRITDISRVVAPPYDVVSAELRDELLLRDPHNVIRLILGKAPPGGRSHEDYCSAGRHLARWRDEGILIREEKPSIYIVEQTFELNGKPVRRVGFVAALLLEEFGAGQVFPHEHTMAGPRADRLNLMRVCRTNLSQVFGIYCDPEGKVDRFVREIGGAHLLCEFRDEANVPCVLRRVDDAGQVEKLKLLLRDATVCIADGHHRYETALAYRDEARPPSVPPGTAPQDFTTALLVSVADGGLRALPTHRLVAAGAGFDERAFLSGLRRDFRLSRVSVGGAEEMDRAFWKLRQEGAVIGCYLAGGRLFGLHVSGHVGSPQPQEDALQVSKLPVSILNAKILPRYFGADPSRKREDDGIQYQPEAGKVYEGVESGRFHAGFLLPPVEPQLVECIARSGQRLPPKSTFFYPKMPSGLLMYPFD